MVRRTRNNINLVFRLFPSLSGDNPAHINQTNSTEQVIMNKQSKEQYRFQLPTGFDFISFRITPDALALLNENTENRHGEKIPNNILFQDLLSRMTFRGKISNDFRRPLRLEPGQTQYSELRLTDEWQMNRTRLRNLLDRMESVWLIYTVRTTIGSIMSFPCVRGWCSPGKPYTVNPMYSDTDSSIF